MFSLSNSEIRRSWRGLLLSCVMVLAIAACGDETATKLTNPGADVGTDTGEHDAQGDDTGESDGGPEPGLALGAGCQSDDECESGDCRVFGAASICTEPCDGACPAEGLACHDGVCTPQDYCDNGSGPGCPPPPGCEVCDDDAECIAAGEDDVSCECRDGFEGDGLTCEDIDECADPDLNNCDENATCTNTEGDYTCECASGYEGDGFSCEDIDECADEDLNNCAEGATCTNTPGGFDCGCGEGFTGDGITCEDIDECADEDLNDCDENATCTNTEGAYTCECELGFDGDGFSCEDIDECADANLNNCDENATCTNTEGDYTCECEEGFEGDGLSCQDIDECADANLNNCDANATCTNMPGGYVCGCDAGYTGDGFSCQDIDECADANLNNCDANATCANTDGSYTCGCDAGYTGDGFSCQDIDECADADLNNCDANATCTNTPGSFTCDCNEWYSGNGVSCVDVVRDISGGLDPNDPGTWADGTFAVSCQDYRDPADPLYTYAGSVGDGFYTIEPSGSQGPTVVYCDMSTDGGGWTGIDPTTANQLFGVDMTTLGGSGCTMENDKPQALVAGTVKCRFDFELGIEFNVMRTENVEIIALAGNNQTADLTTWGGDWGEMTCTHHGDVIFGTPAHTGGTLSLGQYYGISQCAYGPEFSNGTSLIWDNDEKSTSRDTVLRLEMGEIGGQLEGWRWESGYIFVRNDIQVEGALTADDPGMYEDATVATSCQEYRWPTTQGYLESLVDGHYLIEPQGSQGPTRVYCDMTTDGGGWTGLDPEAADQLFGVDMTTLGGTGCTMENGRPQALATNLVQCRFDYELGIEFNVMRTMNVEIIALAGNNQTSDLTYWGGDWGDMTCNVAGDVIFGTPADTGGTLSLGQYHNVSQCVRGPEFTDGTSLIWDGDEQYTVRDTVLRLEMGEEGTQLEGWRWESGYIFVRNDIQVEGALTADGPGTFEDATLATSCEEYRRPTTQGYAGSNSRVDGMYSIDPDGDGPIAPVTVFCDMTTEGGGWTQIAHVRKLDGMPYPGRDAVGDDPDVLGYTIDASGIAFSELALTHNGFEEGSFASFTLANPSVWDAAQPDIAFALANGRWAIFALSAASSSGWGDIPLTCINSTRLDCLQQSRTTTFGAVASGNGNCQQLNDTNGGGGPTTCGGWGLGPNTGNTTWARDGGRIFLK